MLLYNILIFNDTLHTWLHHYAVSTLAPRRKVGWLLVLSHKYTPAGSLAASSLVQHLLGSAAHLHQVQPEAASHADCVVSEHASVASIASLSKPPFLRVIEILTMDFFTFTVMESAPES